jgi:hypothetical protein
MQTVFLGWIALAITVLAAVFIWYVLRKFYSDIEDPDPVGPVPEVVYRNGKYFWITFYVHETDTGEMAVEKIAKFLGDRYDLEVEPTPTSVNLHFKLVSSGTTVKSVGVTSPSPPHGAWEMWFLYESQPSTPITVNFTHRNLRGVNHSGTALDQ